MVDQRRIDDQRWLDAATAARHLGISVRSLYAYVSRGQVRSMPGERGRPRLYAFADLERLRVRRDARAGHGAVAAGALRWGEPVLDSAITAITARGPAYRGRLAVDLAEAAVPFENVAELLWSGYLPDARIAWPRVAIPLAQLARLVGDARSPLDVMPSSEPSRSFSFRTSCFCLRSKDNRPPVKNGERPVDWGEPDRSCRSITACEVVSSPTAR